MAPVVDSLLIEYPDYCTLTKLIRLRGYHISIYIMTNDQIKFWEGDFGNEYTDRNSGNLNEFYQDSFGITRTEMNLRFLDDLPRDIRILEVGCNRGLQLNELKKIGFTNLWGVEINHKAFQIVKKDFDNVVISSGLDLPYKDNFFDLTFTSGVLIHIAPENYSKFFAELYRTSRQYIWGYEYYSETLQEVDYRGNSRKLWKTDFCSEMQAQFPDLELVKQEKYQYSSGNNQDYMYLLKKS